MRLRPNLIDNLMTQFNEGKGYQEIRAIKHLSLKMEEVTSILEITEKKGKLCQKNHIYQPVTSNSM